MPPTAASNSSPIVCQTCGTPLAAGKLAAQCPQCLLSLASDFGLPDGDAVEAGMLDATQVRSFGDYELIEEIARGGMGVVYRARQISLNREVAVKMILAGERAGREARRMFQREAQAAANLHHANIVPVYEIGEHETQHYFTMRFVPGGQTIAHWAQAHRGEHREIAATVAKVARAVAHAHERGVLHRDLKPSNILWDSEAGPQVTDFGLAKLLNQSDGTRTTGVHAIGSPSYMAPEQMGGRTEEITTATDVYGLGAVLYEMLTGKPPFVGASALETMRRAAEDAPALPAGVPRDLGVVCLKCLEKKQGDRYASAAALADDLERFARGEPVRARPVTTPEAVWRWARRNPKVAVLLGALVLAFVLGFAGVTWQWRAAEAARRGEASARARATATVVDLYTSTGLAAAKEDDTTRAALWFAQAAATSGADAAGREVNLARWAAWRGDSTTAVRAFESGIGQVGSIVWRPQQDAIIVGPRRLPLERVNASTWEHPVAAVWDLPNESRWLPQVTMMAAAWARRGECIVFTDGQSVRLVEYPSGREVASTPCEAVVPDLAVSGDDRWVAVGGSAPFLWDVAAGQTRPLPASEDVTVGLEFSRDGQRLLMTSFKRRSVCALDHPEQILFPPVEHIGGAAEGFIGNGELFFSHAFSNQILILRSDTGEVAERYPCPSDPQLPAVGVSPDGRFIARYSRPIIERPGGERSFPTHKNRFESLDFSRDGSLLATASADDTVRLWHLPDGGGGKAIGWHQEGATAVTISPDNRFVATGQAGGSLVRIWRLTQPPQGRAIAAFPNSRIRLSHDGKLLIPSGRPDYDSRMDRTRVVDVETGEAAGPEIVPAGPIMDAAFALDAAWVVLACSTTPDRSMQRADQPDSGTVEFLDFRTGQRLGEPIVFQAEPRAVAVHPSGKKIAVYGAKSTLWEVDVATRAARELRASAPKAAGYGSHAGVRYSPDGRMLLAWGLDSPPLLWDGETEKFREPPEWARSKVIDLDIHGDWVGSGSMESAMQFLALPDGQPVAPVIKDTNWIFVTRFSPEGDLFLTGGRGRIGHVWDWRHGKLNCPALQHDGEIFGGAFLPGTECVATSGLDKVIRFWDRRTGLPLRAPLRQNGIILNLTVTPDGRTLVSDGKDGTDIRIYDIATLLPRPALSPEAALLLAEIDAAAEIPHGSIEPLSPAAWLQKWRQFREKHPEWHRW